MWELLLALFGGATIAGRLSNEKNARRIQQEEFEATQERLKTFRSSVTKPSVENAVECLIYNAYETGDITRISNELNKVFENITDLRGLGDKWCLSNSKPPASNLKFITLVLCINRGCVPICEQWGFRIWPYFVGMEFGKCKYARISELGMHQFADWAVDRLKSFGIDITLHFATETGANVLNWK